MKVLRLCVMIALIAGVFSCKKKEYPDSVTDPESTFYFKGNVNDSAVSFGAGINDYYMYSAYKQDSAGVYNFTGNLKQTSCQGNCPNSVLIRLRDSRVSATGAAVNTDSAFAVNSYLFAGTIMQAYQVSFQSSYNRTAASYLWDFGDGSTSTAINPVHTYAARGTYQVCLTIKSTNGCVSSICNTQKIGLPGVPCTTAIDVTNTSGNTLSFSQTSAGLSPMKFVWDFGDGVTSNSPTPVHTYSIAGSYPVSLRVTDSNNDVAFSTYNTLTQLDQSSCTANYKVLNIIPINPANYLNLSKVGFSWTDRNGSVYTSENITQPASSYLQVLSAENYSTNENGQKTKKLHVKFKCLLTNGSSQVRIDNADAVICVAYN